MLGVTILGNNSALPAYDRHPTSQVVTVGDQLLLIDCGEATQIQMSKYKIRRSKINHIFISHLHGDHYFGLIGLITSMGLLNRETDLHIYAHAALEPILQLQLAAANTQLPFSLSFHPLPASGMILDEKKFTVSTFSTQHRIPCNGFVIKEKKKPRKVNKQTIDQYDIPAAYYEQLQDGMDYETKQGAIIANHLVTIPNSPPLSYAFCADTIYDEGLIAHIQQVSLLYHEATYLKTMNDRAAFRFHSTTEQAATLALKAQVGKLIIGHFSSKYEVLDSFLEEAQATFANTDLALEGVTFRFLHSNYGK